MARKPTEFRGFPAALLLPYGPYMASVQHIVDGDTFDAFIDIGLNEYPYRICRILGIDAPETNRAASREAGVAAKAYLESLMPVGSPVQLVTRPDPDSFGRYLVRVMVKDGTDVGAAMLAAGHAVVYER